MEKMLHRLETFAARGSDGATYTVHGYEHMARVDTFPTAEPQWESTGVAEYKLASGAPIQVLPDGSMQVRDRDLRLQRT